MDKIVDSEYNMEIQKSVKISIGIVMRNRDMLKFVSDHLKIQKLFKNAVKKLSFLIRYVPDQFKTQQM